MIVSKEETPSLPIKKSSRRKGKDSESRDFICKCGKKYLSHAAIYTHVKTKHSGLPEFQKSIIRPQKPKEMRGRPKKRKMYAFTPENQKLSIIQESILSIFEAMINTHEEYSPKVIILAGNQKFSNQMYQHHYEKIIRQHGNTVTSIGLEGNELLVEFFPRIGEFVRVFTQHFIPEVAAKIIYTLNSIIQIITNIETINLDNRLQIQLIDIEHESINKVELLAIWDNNSDIIEIIANALKRWLIVDQNQEKA